MSAFMVFALLVTVTQDRPATADWPKEAASKAEQEVKKLEREWLDAYEKRDADAMDRIVADDFTITFLDGTVQTKPQLMADIRKPRNPTQPAPKFSTEDVKARTYGNTVILIGRVITEVRRGDKVVREQSRYTDTYVKKDERWQVVASHLSRVAEPTR